MTSLQRLARIAGGLMLVFALAASAAANTLVGGSITANTVWTLANSPTGDVHLVLGGLR